MPDSTFFAGFDSPNANNGSLNVQPGVVEIQFVATSGGDLTLDRVVGGTDPNTLVIIDGITYSFNLVETGVFPGNGAGGGDPGDKVPTSLEGERVVIIRIENYDADGDGTGDGPQQFFFTPDYDATLAEIDAVADSGIKLGSRNTNPPPEPVCYLSGTLIQTPSGPVAVDDLQSGDLVMTVDGGSQPLAWATSSLHTWPGSDEKHKPILIKQGAFGTDLPDSDLSVSPQHHIVMKGKLCVALFGADEVLAPAKGLTGLAGVRVMAGKKAAEYFHLMMAQHEILIAQGVETESFYPGPTSLQMMSAGQRASLLAVVPTLRDDPENGYGPTARKKITRRQAEQLVEAMKNEAKETEAFAG
jgi:hypothetical protein